MSHAPIYVFDAYGTLFDVHAAASKHRAEIGDAWERFSQTWRQKHLEYTWIHAMTGQMRPFWTLTQRSLDFAIASVGGVPPGVREKLLLAYRSMEAFPEVADVLAALKGRGSRLAVLSNGDPDMLVDAVQSGGLKGIFDDVISVQGAGIFKPDMSVYRLVTDKFDCAAADVSFQSSNRWDVAGAKAFGFKTVWVNRGGAPDEYPEMGADVIGRDLNVLLTQS